MNLYQNLWAGHPTYFLETGHSYINRRGTKNGIGFYFGSNGDLYIDWKAQIYSSSFKEHPERYPLIGKISEKEFADMIMKLATSKKKELSYDKTGTIEPGP